MNELLRQQLGDITEDEFKAAFWAGEQYLEVSKNTGIETSMKGLLSVMANNIKRLRGLHNGK